MRFDPVEHAIDPLRAGPAEMGPLGFSAGSQGVAFGRDQWCPGSREGEVIATRMNPVIWSR
jgi:hypothetical protein